MFRDFKFRTRTSVSYGRWESLLVRHSGCFKDPSVMGKMGQKGENRMVTKSLDKSGIHFEGRINSIWSLSQCGRGVKDDSLVPSLLMTFKTQEGGFDRETTSLVLDVLRLRTSNRKGLAVIRL